MKKLLLLLFIFTSLARAQSGGDRSNPLGADLQLQDAGTCSTKFSFLWQQLPGNASSTTVNLAGTFSATVTVRVSNNGGATWATLGTQNAVGTVSYTTQGFTDFCADITTYTSGKVSISINTGLLQVQSITGGTSGGGPSSVTSLPATCTPGTTANVVLTTGPPTVQQEYQCGPAPNQWFPFNPSLAISPLTFGAKWDVKAVTDAAFTNTSNTVTCPNSDCNFTSGDLGKIVFGTTFPVALTTGCNGAACGHVILPQGFICAINNANSISVGTTFPGCAVDNATASCAVVSNTPNCALLWGTQDDSAAIQSAATAAWGTAGACKALALPSGMAFFTVPSGGLFNVSVGNGSPCSGIILSDSTQTGPLAYGTGTGVSVLVPLPSVNFANCTGGNAGTACISGPPNWFGHDFSVWGFGQADNGTTHANNLIEFAGNRPGCVAAAAWNLSLNNWEAASASSQGFVLNNGCGVLYASNVVSEGFGNTNCVLQAQAGANVTVNSLDCFGAGGSVSGVGSSLILNGAVFGGTNPSVINTTGSYFWGGFASANVAAVTILGSGVIWNSFSDVIRGPTEGNNNFGIFFNNANTAQVNLQGSIVSITDNAGAGNAFDFFCSSAVTNCNISAYAANIIATGAKAGMFTKTGTPGYNFFDACSNTYTQGGLANVALNIFGSCSITGTVQTASNITPTSGFGTGCATAGQCISAVSGNSLKEQFTVTYGTTPSSPQVITIVWPTPFIIAPICSMIDVGGTNAFPTSIVTTTCTATGASFTITNTPVGGNTDIFQVNASN